MFIKNKENNELVSKIALNNAYLQVTKAPGKSPQ